MNTINFPLSWQEYEADARIFEDCESLKSITVPEGVTILPGNVFEGSNYLENVSLPSTLTEIKYSAFRNCTAIQKLYISPNVTSVGIDAFTGATNLKIYCDYGSCVLQYAISNDIPYYYLSLVGCSLPSGTIYEGDDNHIYGTIRSSDPIETAEVKVYDSTGAVVRSGSVTNGATLINLNTYLDDCVSLSTMPSGTYRIEVSASTAEETKTFRSSRFTVAPPPLRTMITNASIPSRLYKIGATFELKGVIQSNYVISSVTAGIYNDDGTETEFVKTVTPCTTTYNMENLADTAAIDKLSDGKYTYKIVIVSNGETVVLKANGFGMGTAGGEGITDQDLKQMLVFAKEQKNKYAFSGLTYDVEYLNSLSIVDAFTVALVSGEKIISEALTDQMLGNEYSSYAVDLYKKQIVAVIDELVQSGYKDDSDLKLYKTITGWIKSAEKLEQSSLREYFQSLEEERGKIKDSVQLVDYNYTLPAATYAGMIQLGDMIDGLEFFENGLSFVEDTTEVLEMIMRNYEKETNILDAVANAMGETSNPNFNEAMRQVREEFNSEYVAIARKVLDEVKQRIGKEAIGAILSAVGGGTYTLVSLAKSMTFKLTGFEKRTENIMKFVSTSETFSNAYFGYQNAFDRVYEGDESEEALRSLLICFDFTYACADRMYSTIYDLSPASKKAEVWDHIENDLWPISIYN